MGLLNRTVAAVWRLPRAIFNAPLTTPTEPGERIIYVGRTPAGIYVTPDECLKISTVWACVSVIAKAISSCKWEVLEEDRDGNRELRRDLPLWRRLNMTPNPEMTAFSFREAALTQALLWGNFYAEIERNMRGDPVALWPLDPDRVVFDRNRDGELVCDVQNSTGRVSIPYRNIFHLHGPSINGLEGMSVVTYGARTFGHAAAAEIFGAAFYGNGTQMGGVLSTDGSLSETQRNDLLEGIAKRHAGPDNAHKFLLLQGGLKFSPLAPTQEQSQFIETRQFLVAEVCRFFGVPPHKVADLERSTNNNIEHQGLEFVRDALVPWAERLTQEADSKLLPFGNRLLTTRMDLEWLSEGDIATRAEADAKHVGAGVRTRNEVRRDHGWNALPEANGLTVQKQYSNLDQIEKLVDAEIAKTKQEAKPPPAPVERADNTQADQRVSRPDS